MPQIEPRLPLRKPSKKKPAKRAPLTKSEALTLLRSEAGDDGELITSRDRIGRRCGCAHATVSKWLKEWSDEGVTVVEKMGSKGTKIIFLDQVVKRSCDAIVPPTEAGQTGGHGDGSHGAPSIGPGDAGVTPDPTSNEGGHGDGSRALPEAGRVEVREPADVIRFPALPAPEMTSKRPRKRRSSDPAAAVALALATEAPALVEVAPAVSATPALHVFPRALETDPLPFLRDANAMRFLAVAAAAASIVMVAYHAAAADAENPVKWGMVLFVALVTATAKPILGLLAENLRAGGDRSGARYAVAFGLLALMIDASILFAFRGEGLANRAAIDAAAEAARKRVVERVDLLRGEQKRLVALEAGASQPAAIEVPAIRLPGEIRPLIAALDEGADPKGACRWIQPRAERGKPVPEKRRANAAACEAELAGLRSELARAEAAEAGAARAASEIETRRVRLAELPGLIEAAEADLAKRQVHGTTDGGAALIARGLNWIPAGFASAFFGVDEFRPVEADGVLTGLTWGFVLVIELLALYGLGLASRCDRARRNRLALS